MAEDIRNIHSDEEGDVCRVCRTGEDEGFPLVYPCKCSGSVRYVHPDCLKQWVAQSQNKRCEICGYEYTYTNIYADVVPDKISPKVYLRHGLLWVRQQILRILRICFVIVTWLVILPSVNMLVLHGVTLLVDFIGVRPSPEQTSDVVGNATLNNASNLTSFGNSSALGVSQNGTLLGGSSLMKIVSGYLTTTTAKMFPARDNFQSGKQGNENSVISFVLRGQILSMSLAAVLIGLVLLRDWLMQHNWTEAQQVPPNIEPDPNPDDWLILNGVARHQAGIIAQILEITRAATDPGNDQDRLLILNSMGVGGGEDAARKRREFLEALPGHERESIAQVIDFLSRAGDSGDLGETTEPVSVDDVQIRPSGVPARSSVSSREGALMNDEEKVSLFEREGYQDPAQGEALRKEQGRTTREDEASSPPKIRRSMRRFYEEVARPPLEGEEEEEEDYEYANGESSDDLVEYPRLPGPGFTFGPNGKIIYPGEEDEDTDGQQGDAEGVVLGQDGCSEAKRPRGDQFHTNAEAGPSTISQTDQGSLSRDALAEYRQFHAQKELLQSSSNHPSSSTGQIPIFPSREFNAILGDEETIQASDSFSGRKGKAKSSPEASGFGNITASAPVPAQQWDRDGEHEGNDDADDREHGGGDDGDWEDEGVNMPLPRLNHLVPVRLEDFEPDDPRPLEDVQGALRDRLAQLQNRERLQVQNIDEAGRVVNIEFVEGREVEDEDEGEDDDVFVADGWNGVLEFIGLMGPIAGLLQNLIFALIIMGGAVLLLVGLPMILGKIYFSLDIIRSSLSISLRILHLVRKVTDPVVDIIFEIVKDVVVLPLLASVRAAQKITVKSLGLEIGYRFGSAMGFIKSHFPFLSPTASPDVPSSSAPTVFDRLGDFFAAIGQYCYDVYNGHIALQHHLATSRTISGRAACVVAGYVGFIGSVILVAVFGDSMLGKAAAELADGLRQQSSFAKVSFFMTLELVAFPLAVGLMIDLSTVPLFPGATVISRLLSFTTLPFATCLIDWLIGSMFMFAFSSLLGQVRKLTRPGTMFFIRDPSDKNFSPVKDILDKSTLHQLRKLGSSAIMYSVVVFSLFGVASWAVSALPIKLLPLHIDTSYNAISSVPFDLLFLHLALLPIFDIVRPKSRARRLFATWWRYITVAYRLTNLVSIEPNTTEKTDENTVVEKYFWPFADFVCQTMFGKYKIDSTEARVPASDSVVLMPLEQRRKEGGVFIPLNFRGVPTTDADTLRLLKQDKLSREANRNPVTDYMVVWLPQYWRTRVHVFVATALASLGLVFALLALVPLLVGRMMWQWVGQDVHDGYSWFAGALIIIGSISLGRKTKKYIMAYNRSRRLRASNFSKRVKRTLRRRMAGAWGVTVMYLVLPVLLGAVLDIYFGGLWKDKNNPGRVIHFWDIWSLGVVSLSATVGIMSFVPPTYTGPVRKIAERFHKPTANDFLSTTEVASGPVQMCCGLIFLPHFIGLLTASVAPDTAEDDLNNAVIFRSVIIPGCLVFFIVILAHHVITSQAGNIRQAVVDAEYVVEERIDNYVPPQPAASDSGKKVKPGSHAIGTAAPATTVNGDQGTDEDEDEEVETMGDEEVEALEDEWEDM